MSDAEHKHRLPYVPEALRKNEGKGKMVSAICIDCGEQFVHTTPPVELVDGEQLKVTFTNEAPEDKEWSAHIDILNEWQNPERTLRDIIQYARSGPFYPADMHVRLIEQWHVAHLQAAVREAELKGQRSVWVQIRRGEGFSHTSDGCAEVHPDFCTESIDVIDQRLNQGEK